MRVRLQNLSRARDLFFKPTQSVETYALWPSVHRNAPQASPLSSL